jgi:tetratricopeptide (TPR) repeat protein
MAAGMAAGLFEGVEMSRFSRLEFEGKRAVSADGKGEPIRDETFFYERAMSAWLAGDYETALTNYSRSLEKNSAFYESWFGQVRMLIELGEYREANLWADKALELFPNHPELFAAKAVACVRNAEFDKAMAYSDNAVEKQNITWYVWLARAEVLMNRKSRMAESCIASGIGVAGEWGAVAKLEAGRLLLHFENYSSALAYLRDAFTELPRSALTWYELGRCQSQLGLPEARKTLENCLKLRPGWKQPEQELIRFMRRGLLGRIIGIFRRIRRN